ncbi:hypothetical protein SB748_24845 [Rhizobium sp. SIMBA_035]
MLALTICLPIAFAVVLLAAVILRLIPAGGDVTGKRASNSSRRIEKRALKDRDVQRS